MILALVLILTSCGLLSKLVNFADPTEEPRPANDVNIGGFVENLSEEDLLNVGKYTDWIGHPFKEVIAQFGTNYEIVWEVNEYRQDELTRYITLEYGSKGISFVADTAFTFICLETYGGFNDFRDYNCMEYIPYLVVTEVVFTAPFDLFDGVRVGDTLTSIAKKEGYTVITVDDMSYYREETDGHLAYVRSCTVSRGDCDCYVTVRDDTLEKVRILSKVDGIKDKAEEAAALRSYLEEAVRYVNAKQMALYNINLLSYDAYRYVPSYDTWVHCWKFRNGEYKDTYLCVEAEEPHRIFAMNDTREHMFVFWRDGSFVHPIMSFLGKWRRPDKNSYIDVKAVSAGGEIIFDMCKDGVLIKNINASLYYNFATFDDLYGADGYAIASLQYATEADYSGFIFYGGYQPMSDRLVLDFAGEVDYIGTTGRGGAPGLQIHLPYQGDYASADFESGVMGTFGSADKNGNTAVVGGSKAKAQELINSYMNEKYRTKGLDYAGTYFKYAHDYTFPIDNKTYSVWKSNIENDSFILYVDSKNGVVIKEIYYGPLRGYAKTKVYENGKSVDGQKMLPASLKSPDGKIRVSFESSGRLNLEKQDAFIPKIENIEISSNYSVAYTAVCTDYYFYAKTGANFIVGGYISFNHYTWSYTLHITNSNIKGWDLGVYPLFDDGTLGNVVFVDATDENDAQEAVGQAETTTTQTICIRDKNFSIIGYVTVDANGNKTVRDRSFRILGYYRASNNATYNATWQLVCYGDAAVSLLYN